MQIRFQIKFQEMLKDEEWILFFMHSDLHNNQIIYNMTYFHHINFFWYEISK